MASPAKSKKSASFEIVHTGDIHVGACRSVFDYLNRHKTALQEIIDLVAAKVAAGINVAVALGGDLADRKNMSEEERDLIMWFVVELVRLGVHVIIINGNHDFYNEDGLTMIHPLHTMQKLCPKKLHVVVDNPDVVDIPELDLSFLCIPCHLDLTTKRLRNMLDKLEKKAKCRYRYGLVHEAINGSIANDNHKMSTKCDIPETKLDGILLNDIHRCQRVGRAAWYSGSPLQIKSNEDPEKGVLVWKCGIEDPELVLLRSVPKIIEVKTEKMLRKLEGTKHSVTYVGKKRIESDAVNVRMQPNLKTIQKKIDVTDAVAEVSENVVEGLGDALKADGLTDEEIVEALGMVEMELTK